MGIFQVSSRSSSKGKEELKRFFERCGKKDEKDNQIKLYKEDLKKAFDRLGALMPGYKAASALKYIDTDNSGYVNGDELEALVEYVYGSGYRFRA